MSEGLTFNFVFRDDSPNQSEPAREAPPEAEAGAALRNPSPSTKQAPPAPRATSASPTSTGPIEREQPAPGAAAAAEERDKTLPEDRTGTGRAKPRRTGERTDKEPAREESPRPRPPSIQSKEGQATKLLADLVRHLQQVPGIGRAIASLYHVAEPLVAAGKQIRQMRETEAKKQEGGQRAPPRPEEEKKPQAVVPHSPAASEAPSEPTIVVPALETVEPEPRPVPQTETESPPAPVSPSATQTPRDLPPASREPPESGKAAEAGFRIAPAPSSSAALEQLIGALGPLPEETRALKETLEPLTSLGYTMTELLAAVREMARAKEERAPGVEGARPGQPGAAAEKEPEEAPDDKNRRPAKPRDKIDLTDKDLPKPRPADNGGGQPPTVPLAPTSGAAAANAPVEAGAAADIGAGAAGAAESGVAVAGAAFGPAGLVAGISAVAVIGTATRAISGLANAAKAADRSLQETAHRLAPFSGALSASLANAQVRQIMNDIERARNIGPDLASYNTARADIARALERLEDIPRKFALERVTPLLELLARAVEEGVAHEKEIKIALDVGFHTLFPKLALAFDLAKKIAKLLEKSAQEKWDPLNDIMGIFGHANFNTPLAPFDQQGALKGMRGIRNPLVPKPIVPGPGVPPGQGIGGI
jgi:hypothetical protein